MRLPSLFRHTTRRRAVQAEDQLVLLVVDQHPTVGIFGLQAFRPSQWAQVSHALEHSRACGRQSRDVLDLALEERHLVVLHRDAFRAGRLRDQLPEVASRRCTRRSAPPRRPRTKS